VDNGSHTDTKPEDYPFVCFAAPLNGDRAMDFRAKTIHVAVGMLEAFAGSLLEPGQTGSTCDCSISYSPTAEVAGSSLIWEGRSNNLDEAYDLRMWNIK